MSNQIEIKIDAKKLSPDKFLEGAKEFFAMVEGVTKNLGKNPIDWTIVVDKGSAVVRMVTESEDNDTEETTSTVNQGIRALRNGIRSIPHGFTKREVEAAKALAGLIDGQSVQSIFIKNGDQPEEILHSIVDVANAILVRESHDAFGSVEGKILTLSAKQGFMCTIYDQIERREIVCFLQKTQLRHEVIKAFDRDVRILAGGLIHYAKEGNPVNITVDTVRLFPPDSDLPSVEEIQAIYKLYK